MSLKCNAAYLTKKKSWRLEAGSNVRVFYLSSNNELSIHWKKCIALISFAVYFILIENRISSECNKVVHLAPNNYNNDMRQDANRKYIAAKLRKLLLGNAKRN